MKYIKWVNWIFVERVVLSILLIFVCVGLFLYETPWVAFVVCLTFILFELYSFIQREKQLLAELEAYKSLYGITKSALDKFNLEMVNGVIPHNIARDRVYLLLLMAKSFYKAGKLIIEKKHPDAKNITLCFQLNNGNIRFSVLESAVPTYLIQGAIILNKSKINYNTNYRLIEEVIKEK